MSFYLPIKQTVVHKGTVELHNGKKYIQVPKVTAGCALWGPYERLGEGKYVVRFEIEPDGADDLDASCCRIDVVKDGGRTKLFEKIFSARDLQNQQCVIDANFELSTSGLIEYRVFSMGNAALRVAFDRKAKVVLDDKAALSFMKSGVIPENNKFFTDNYSKISSLGGFNVKFEFINDQLIGELNGIRFQLENDEDFELINEIFFVNVYNLISPIKCTVIDIGMNIGFASLAFAANPQVESVYSFEPFKTPYDRACRNFDLNPLLSAKIKANNFALSDKNCEQTVLSQETKTIGVSVMGASSGKPETIQLRDAGSELKELIESANARELAVVLKVDCEGSEFPIFESLGHYDLFEKIDVFMIEWHKWWSKEKTQHDLIRPLTKAGFFVFDMTNPRNRYAGILAAVRSGKRTGPSQSTKQ
jgi:FkbM family methyltransferase